MLGSERLSRATESAARRLTALAAVAVLAAPIAVAGTALPTPPPASVKAITPAEVRKHLEFLASKELGGRYTLSEGNRKAADYLAARLKDYGFKGAMPDGSFIQPFDVVESKVDAAASTLALTVGGKTTSFEYGDFSAFRSGPGTAEAPVVFVGYGVSAPQLGHDDYAGLDVKGKIVLTVPGVPKGLDAAKVKAAKSGERAAREHGAVAILSFVPPQYAAYAKMPGYKEVIKSMSDVALGAGESRIPAATLVGPSADLALGLLGTNLDAMYKSTAASEAMPPRPLDMRAAVTIKMDENRARAQNVVGVLEGTDPALKGEYVAFSAHYDHLATGEKGEVYPGADDDGSGTAAVLTIARALSLDRPRRSVFVIFHSGEELGLLGSEYNADFAPAVPLDRIVVDLNIDMIGRSKAAGDTNPRNAALTGPNGIYLIGADKISTELNQISEQTNSDFEKLKIDYTYNNENHPERFYYRSDHYNYAKNGIPIIFYFSGVHEDYHRPTDTIDKIDFEKAARVTRLVFETGWRIANLDHRLRRDVPQAAAAAAH